MIDSYSLPLGFMWCWFGPFPCSLHLEDVKEPAARKTLFKIKSWRGGKCTKLLLVNLKAAEWLPVNCNTSLLKTFLCSIPKANLSQQHLDTGTFCSSHDLRVSGICLHLSWFDGRESSKNTCDKKGRTHLHLSDFEIIYSLSKTHKLSPIGFGKKIISSAFTLLVFENIRKTYLKKQRTYPTTISCFYFCTTRLISLTIRSNLFECTSGSYISALLVCDNFCHCQEGNDETECFHKTYFQAHPTFCPTLHYMSFSQQCLKYYLKEKSFGTKMANNTTFGCQNGKIISHSLVNDLVPDCHDAEDEIILKRLLISNIRSKCKNQSFIQCEPGHPRCFHISEMCTFTLNKFQNLKTCRNGAHLKNCKDFQCNVMFKCPSFYCIPWENVCDGMWNCPKGMDETAGICSTVKVCEKMFKCDASAVVCISIGTVCDGTTNCPKGEDEKLCVLSDIVCPDHCQCLALAISCRGTHINVEALFSGYLSLSFAEVNLRNWQTFGSFSNLIQLALTRVFLKKICNRVSAEKLYSLLVQFNSLSQIERYCFQASLKLVALRLTDNEISLVQKKAFHGLLNLKSLNLSNNCLDTLPPNIFPHLLKAASVHTNPLGNIQVHSCTSLTATVIQTENFRICCCVPSETICKAEKMWFQSCNNLLSTTIVKASFYLVSVLIISGNIFCIFLHIKFRKRGKQHAALTMSVNLTDVVLGFYLLTLIAADTKFADQFVFEQDGWKSDVTCVAAHTLVLSYNVLSPVISFLMSFSRFRVVIHPLETHFEKTSFVVKRITSSFICSFVTSIAASVWTKLMYKAISTSWCSPFVDHSKTYLVVKVFTIIISCLQVPISCVVGFLHYLIVRELTKKPSFRVSKQQLSSNTPLVVQLAFATVSNALVWWTSNLIFLICLHMSKYSISLIIWNIVAVSSGNALTHPSVFVFSLIRSVFKEKNKKYSFSSSRHVDRHKKCEV